MAVERNPRRDHRDYESQASDAAEDTEGANQWVFGEVLDQVFPQRRLRLWESFQLVDQNPDATKRSLPDCPTVPVRWWEANGEWKRERMVPAMPTRLPMDFGRPSA